MGKDISAPTGGAPGETLAGRWKGLSAFQIKVLAVVFMTIDHIGAFAFEIPAVEAHYSLLRSIGRLAAPLFLFLLVQSIRHTRSKGKFLLRLYLAGAGTGLFVALMNLLFGERFHYFTPGNIIFTFFYVALYALLSERALGAVRDRDWRTAALCAAVGAVSLLPTLLADTIREAIIPEGASMRAIFLADDLHSALLPGMGMVSYGLGFILLGVVMYHARTKTRQCAVFGAFCVLCYGVMSAGAVLGIGLSGVPVLRYFTTFFDRLQLLMVFALPLMALYNGQRGRGGKWFFYLYYPIHREIIFLFAAVFFPVG